MPHLERRARVPRDEEHEERLPTDLKFKFLRARVDEAGLQVTL